MPFAYLNNILLEAWTKKYKLIEMRQQNKILFLNTDDRVARTIINITFLKIHAYIMNAEILQKYNIKKSERRIQSL